MKIPRLLRDDEIECRLQSVNAGKGKNEGKAYAVLLLYKDARCDMNLLDETYGPENWQRDHKEVNGNLFCGVGIRPPAGDWVWKWDAGSESNQEKEKGHASSSFKRACVNWGLGRELYTSPQIFFELNEDEFYIDQQTKKPKAQRSAVFSIKSIGYNDKREINSLEIVDKKGNVRFKR